MEGGGRDRYAHVNLANWLMIGYRIPDVMEIMNWDMGHNELVLAKHVYLDGIWSTSRSWSTTGAGSTSWTWGTASKTRREEFGVPRENGVQRRGLGESWM